MLQRTVVRKGVPRFAVLLGALLLFGQGGALAQPPPDIGEEVDHPFREQPSGSTVDYPGGGEAFLSLAGFFDSRDTPAERATGTAITGIFEGFWEPSEDLRIGLAVPFGYLSRAGQGGAQPGNLELSGAIRHRFGRFEAHGQAAIGFPTSRLPGDEGMIPLAQELAQASTRMHGRLHAWRFRLEALSFALLGGGSYRYGFTEDGQLEADLTVGGAVSVPTGDGFEGAPVDLQAVLTVTGQVGVWVFGTRLGLASTPSAPGDTTQVSVEPLLRAEFSPAFVELSFLLNLDGPGGLSFEQGRFWSVQLTVGARYGD